MKGGNAIEEVNSDTVADNDNRPVLLIMHHDLGGNGIRLQSGSLNGRHDVKLHLRITCICKMIPVTTHRSLYVVQESSRAYTDQAWILPENCQVLYYSDS